MEKNYLNLAARKAKGYAIAGDILSILDEVPLGTHRIEAGIVMRNGKLLNGILTNSEVWNGLTENDYKELEMVDEYLLRGILKSHSKVAKESIYLETGLLPIRFIIKKRRLNYLRHILSRDKEELISKVYYAQKRRPGKMIGLKQWKMILKKSRSTAGMYSTFHEDFKDEGKINPITRGFMIC